MPDWPRSVKNYERVLDCDFMVYATATQAQLQTELDWCRRRDGSLWQVPDNERHLPDGAENLPEGTMESPFFKALLMSEQRRLVKYWHSLAGHRSETIAAGLGQEPDGKPYDNSGKPSLMCLVRNSHVIWVFNCAGGLLFQRWHWHKLSLGLWMVPT